MSRKEFWKQLFRQQRVVRQLIAAGDSHSDQFWNQHRIMEQMRVRVCNPNNFK